MPPFTQRKGGGRKLESKGYRKNLKRVKVQPQHQGCWTLGDRTATTIVAVLTTLVCNLAQCQRMHCNETATVTASMIICC